LAALSVGLLALSGCSSCKGGSAATKEDLELLPKETEILISLNVKRMRNTPLWRAALDLRDSDANTKKKFDEFTQKCGLDPLTQVEGVTLGFPQIAEDQREFAGVVRGTFDEQKLVACGKEQAQKEGVELTTTDYGSHKIYSSSRGQAYVSFLDKSTVVVGGQEWIKKALDRADGKAEGGSARQNDALMALVKRANTSQAIWGVGVVPEKARERFKDDPKLNIAATMKAVVGSLDFASGLLVDLDVDLGGDEEAKKLAETLRGQLDEAKKNPQIMMTGMSSFLDGVKVEQKGATFHGNVSFTQQQVDDLINRVKGLLSGLKLGTGGPPPSFGGDSPPQ
jgi:hypothetical protein